MGRKSDGPWYWTQRSMWCATIDRRRIELVKGVGPDGMGSLPEAVRLWHSLMAERGAEVGPAGRPPSLDLKSLVNLFLDDAVRRVEAATHRNYKDVLGPFVERCGTMDASDVRPYHVDQWLAGSSIAPNTRRTRVSCVEMVFRWGKRKGYLEANPLEGLDKPRRTRREEIVSPAEAVKILDAVGDGVFKDFLLAIWGTGCRPGEAARVEAKDIDFNNSVWIVKGKTTNATGQMRRVFMPPAIAELCRALAEAHPAGPIFLNRAGTPWRKGTYGIRMARVRKRLGLGKGAVCYSFRHLFATDAEERGVAPATVAALLGHSSVAQLWTYSKLRNRDDHLRDAANKVRGATQTSPSSAEGPAPSGPTAASASASASASAPTDATPDKPRRRRDGT